MKGILLRVGCDVTAKGGGWNPPVDPKTWRYVYTPIPEKDCAHICDCPTYEVAQVAVREFPGSWPSYLSATRLAHLDPDFASLSFGEPFKVEKNALSSRGQTIDQNLSVGDFIAFYAAFQPVTEYKSPLAYCLIGVFHIKRKSRVFELSRRDRERCAHGRRKEAERDLVVWADPASSGRFSRAIPIGEYRDRAYRVSEDLLEAWGGLSVTDGYIQRSARPPFFTRPEQFLEWLNERLWENELVRSNW